MCGIVAVSGNKDVIHDIYESLTVLQHRGQDASGILTNHKGKITLRKSLGLVRDGFSKNILIDLKDLSVLGMFVILQLVTQITHQKRNPFM